MLTTILHSPIAHGALTGLLGAAAADIHAFRTWKSFHDAATYSWSTAAFRWLQGAILGAIAAAGMAGVGA